MKSITSNLRFRYARWLGVCAASRGLPPANAEQRTRIADLRACCRALPAVSTRGSTPNEADWAQAMERLRTLALHSDPRAFLRWDVIIQRMAQSNPPVTAVELAALKALPD